MASIELRRAIPTDAPGLGALHVASWRETYAGLVPDAMLASLSVEARAAMWAEILADPAGGAIVIVAQEQRAIRGFGACGRQRDEALARAGFGGEIGAMYVLRSHQRQNIGRALMAAVAQALLDQNHVGAALWVLEENMPARHFYERLGGTIVREKQEEMADAMLVELAYGWPDLSRLAR